MRPVITGVASRRPGSLRQVIQIIGFALVLVGLGMTIGCAAWHDAPNGAKYDYIPADKQF